MVKNGLLLKRDSLSMFLRRSKDKHNWLKGESRPFCSRQKGTFGLHQKKVEQTTRDGAWLEKVCDHKSFATFFLGKKTTSGTRKLAKNSHKFSKKDPKQLRKISSQLFNSMVTLQSHNYKQHFLIFVFNNWPFSNAPKAFKAAFQWWRFTLGPLKDAQRWQS